MSTEETGAQAMPSTVDLTVTLPEIHRQLQQCQRE